MSLRFRTCLAETSFCILTCCLIHFVPMFPRYVRAFHWSTGNVEYRKIITKIGTWVRNRLRHFGTENRRDLGTVTPVAFDWLHELFLLITLIDLSEMIRCVTTSNNSKRKMLKQFFTTWLYSSRSDCKCNALWNFSAGEKTDGKETASADDDSELPAEYLNSALSKESQVRINYNHCKTFSPLYI